MNDKKNRSIHPRVVGGRTVHDIKDTSKPSKKPVGGHLRKVTAKFDERQADYQRTIAGNKNASAYTMPGSRRLDQ